MYNKSSIMSQANAFRKEGCTASQALVAAWAFAKIEVIDTELRSLEQVDRFTVSQRAQWNALNASKRALRARTALHSEKVVQHSTKTRDELWGEIEDLMCEGKNGTEEFSILYRQFEAA